MSPNTLNWKINENTVNSTRFPVVSYVGRTVKSEDPVLKSYNKRNNNDFFDTKNRANESSVDGYLLVSLLSSISPSTKK